MRRLLAIAVALAVAAAAPAASAAVPSPPTVPGWPKRASPGPVLQGPQGGVVLVSSFYAEAGASGSTARAFRRDGRRLWRISQEAGCGNCDDGPQPVALQPDGSYGPIGYTGDYFWSVDQQGALTTSCAGVVFADGSCVVGGSSPHTTPPVARPAVSGSPPGTRTPSWTVDVPGWFWYGEFEVPPMTVRDAAGIVYVAFANPRTPAQPPGPGIPGLLVAVDPIAQRVLWTVEGPRQALTGLGSGVIVAEGDGIAAYRVDGTVAWRRAVPPGQAIFPSQVAYDAPRGRIYLGRVAATRRAQTGVTALVATTGAQVWRTRPADRARLLSVGRGGRVYVAIERPGHRSVRALRAAAGTTVWERRTRLVVHGARELVNGTVAVSAGRRAGPGLLTLLDPR